MPQARWRAALLVGLTLFLATCAGAAGAATPSRGFPTGQCTTWANTERPYIVDLTMLRLHLSDWAAADWAKNAARGGFPVGAAPAVGAIAVWPANVDDAGPDGHVAYVERILPDGSFLVSESNVNGSARVDERVVAPDPTLRFIYRLPHEPRPAGAGVLRGLSSGLYRLSTGPSTITVELSGDARVLFLVTGPGGFAHQTSALLPGTARVPVARLLATPNPPAGIYTLTADVVGGAAYAQLHFPVALATEEGPRADTRSPSLPPPSAA